MNINQVFQAFFKGIEQGKLDLINMQPGQILRGQVVELLQGGQAIVQLGKSRLLAKVETPLVKGQHALFQVKAISDSILLKILGETVEDGQVENLNKGILQQLKLKNSPVNRLIVTELLNSGIPIEKAQIEAIAENITKNTNDRNTILAVAKLLFGSKTPINGQNLQMVSEFISGQDLFTKLNQLNQKIATFTENAENNPKTIPLEILNQLKNLQAQTQNLIKNAHIHDQEIIPANSERRETPAANDDRQIEKILFNTRDSKITGKDILPKLVNFLEKVHFFANKDSLTENTSAIKNILERIYLERELLPQELSRSIEKVVQHLAGQNLLSTQNDANFSQVLLEVPNFTDSKKTPVYIQINSKKNKDRAIDPEDIRIAFFFQLDQLGETMVKLHVLQQNLVVQMYNNNPLIKEIIKGLEPDFMQTIKAQGFKTTGIVVMPLENTQTKLADHALPQYKGVDIRI